MDLIIYSIISFLGGLLSFFSPCSGILVPAFLSNVNIKNKSQLKYRILLFSIIFLSIVLSFGLIFVNLKNILSVYIPFLNKIIGFSFLIFSLMSLFNISIFKKVKKLSYLNSIILGLYSLGLLIPLILISLNISKLSFLSNLFKKGKLYTINILDNTFYIHTSNIILFLINFLLFYVFFFNNGVIFKETGLIGNFIFDAQNYIYKIFKN